MWPPHRGHTSGQASEMRMMSTALRRCTGERLSSSSAGALAVTAPLSGEFGASTP